MTEAHGSAEKVQHNHVTRNFLPRGKCPGCDAYYDRHGDPGVGEVAAAERPIPPVLRERAEAHGCDVEDETTGRLLACRECVLPPASTTDGDAS